MRNISGNAMILINHLAQSSKIQKKIHRYRNKYPWNLYCHLFLIILCLLAQCKSNYLISTKQPHESVLLDAHEGILSQGEKILTELFLCTHQFSKSNSSVWVTGTSRFKKQGFNWKPRFFCKYSSVGTCQIISCITVARSGVQYEIKYKM